MLVGLKRFPGKVLVDLALFAVAWLAAFLLRFGWEIPDSEWGFLLTFWGVSIGVKLLSFTLCGVHRSVWRYSSLSDLVVLIRAVVVSWVVLGFIVYFLRGDMAFSRTVSVIDALLTLVLTGGVRLGPRVIRESVSPELLARLPAFAQRWIGEEASTAAQPTLIVGAGDVCEAVVRLLKQGEIRGYRPVGIVDEDPQRQGLAIHGIPVVGTIEDIPRVLSDKQCQVVLIALPAAPAEVLRRIASACSGFTVELRIMPDLRSLVTGQMNLADIREVDMEALLGRAKVDLQIQESASYLRGRRVLVTGAGGSIGSELCRQILPFGPAEVVLFGRGENSIFKINNRLSSAASATTLHQVIGDVINKRKLEGVFERYRPEIVFHAGADKHVPLMELNPDEAVLNNVVGTRNVLEVADATRTDLVICISTDKAVNPTSVMGCCKRVAEMLIQGGGFRHARAAGVRFGNVLGSRGSVIPLFEEQIARGGPVTVTDQAVVRYFMTIPEAVQLVIRAGALARGGDLFLLEMGSPVKIADLARNMIRMHGFEPGVDIPIRFTGLRPGEKLWEELLFENEEATPTEHPKILRVRRTGSAIANGDLNHAIQQLTQAALDMDDAEIRRTLKRVVPEYDPYPRPTVTSVTLKEI